jgi:Xaa-Pro aminopeptidase
MKIKELQGYMTDNSIDHCIFLNNPNFFYFSQCKANGALIVSRKDSRLAMSGLDYSDDIQMKKLLWSKGKLLDFLRRQMPKAERIGIDKDNMNFKTLKMLRKSFKGATLINLSQKCVELRMTKTDDEIEKIKKACWITEKILGDCETRFDRYRRETEVSNFLKIQTLEHNCEVAFEPVVASGAAASIPHHIPRGTLRKGFCVIDFGVKYQEYCADLTRTFFIGKPSKREIALLGKVTGAQGQLLSGIKPGIRADSVYVKAKRLLGKYLTHAAGHGVGLEVHEAPLLGSNNPQKLAEGMVLSVEPAMYVARQYGIRTEDMVVVTKKEIRLISKPQEMIRV